MSMPQSTQTIGLCPTCNNAPTCFHRARRGPALFCELFDDYVAFPVQGGHKTSGSGDFRIGFSEPRGGSSGFEGLCGNCEHRGGCWHAKPEGGVWHCEGYE